ncbi:hypothetical protein [Acetobacter sp. P1H12_c]|uniref:hypothetical protein n=1 Tax=Acetobacter sp. P1H12_c TaxID=2762621 RepID=UPI001C03F782|nr:hypothetical protein [Acetobacter sp. P1H12_c]
MRLGQRYFVTVLSYSFICSALVSLYGAGHGPTLTPPAALLYCLGRSGLFFLVFVFLGVPMACLCLSLHRALSRTSHHTTLPGCLLLGIIWACGTAALLGLLLAVASFSLSASGHALPDWNRILITNIAGGAAAGLVFWLASPAGERRVFY